ncbi:hypothetical protein BJB45_15295 [Halomonas huangheensis]|uniref:EamA domain-containing protein n=1 Tax=Halomonas huangheensis TaxID=1178482 RepID=W1N7V3_9GAMM|nr:hypothetical protein BJB45_15295 [Halomonas huangheensis]
MLSLLRIHLPLAETRQRLLGRITTLTIACGLVVCWSSGFIGSRMSLDLNTPLLGFYSWRFALAAAIAWLVVAMRWTRPGARPTWQQARHEMTCGSLTVGVYLLAMLLAVAEGVSANLAALIGALQPLAAALLARQVLRERSCRAQWWGMAVATLGAMTMVMGDMQAAGAARWWAYALPVVAVVAVSVGSILTPPAATSRHHPAPLSLVTRLALQLSAATLLFGLAAVMFEPGLPALPPMRLDSGLALVWLVVLSAYGGYGFLVACLTRLGVTCTSALITLTPAVTLALGVVMYADQPGLAELGGMTLSLAGALWALYAGVKVQRSAGLPHYASSSYTRSSYTRSSYTGSSYTNADGTSSNHISNSLNRHGGRSGPRHHDQAARPEPQTWSTDESPGVGRRVQSRPPRH